MEEVIDYMVGIQLWKFRLTNWVINKILLVWINYFEGKAVKFVDQLGQVFTNFLIGVPFFVFSTNFLIIHI